MKKIIFAYLGIFLVTAFNTFADITLIDDKQQAIIAVPDKNSNELKKHAELLSEYIEKSTTVKTKIINESQAGQINSPIIFLGPCKYVLDKNKAVIDKLTDDGFIISSSGNNVIISGKNDFSTGCGVREFLYRHCGVCWFMPGPLWTVIRQQRTLKVPEGTSITEPSFESRWHSGMDSSLNREWMALQGAVNRYDFHHAYCRYFSAGAYGAKNPDFYSLYNGKRQVPASGSNTGWQLCMTNEKVIDEYAKIADKIFSRSKMKSISVSPNDGDIFCECPECRKLYGNSNNEKSNKTMLVANLANTLAKRVALNHPDRFVCMMSYGPMTEWVPGLKMEPNVMMYFVGCRSTMNNSENRNNEEKKVLNWKNAGVQNIGIYEWHHGAFFNVPVMYPHILGDRMKFYHRNGATGWYSEDYPAWGLQGPSHWIVARLLVDVNLDVDQLLNEYCSRLFGPGAEAMKKYFIRVEEQWTKNSIGGGMAGTSQYKAYPPEVRKELKTILADALKATEKSEPEHLRVRFFSDTFEFSAMTCEYYEAGLRASQMIAVKSYSEAFTALGSVSAREKDPSLFMKQVLDKWEIALFRNSESLDENYFTCTRELLNALITISSPAMKSAAAKILKKSTVTPSAYAEAVTTELENFLPETSSENMNSTIDGLKKLTGRVVFVAKADNKPEMDGNLDESAWKNVPVQSDFFAYGSNSAARFRTDYQVLLNGGRLYMAFKCFEPMENIKTGAKVRDSKVWLDDSVEIFLNKLESGEKEYFQAVVNVEGIIFDQLNGDSKRDFDIIAKTKLYSDHWTLEMSVPLKEIGMDPAEFKGLRFNVVRNVLGRKRGFSTQLSSWFPTVKVHSDKECRGLMFFVK